MEHLRRPLYIAASVLIVLVVLTEVGAPAVLREAEGDLDAMLRGNPELREAWDAADDDERQALLEQDQPPGLAIRYLALIDGLLLFMVGLIWMSLLLRERIQARVQGIVTLIVALVVLLVSLALMYVAIAQLMLMVGLLTATPFGTIAYMARYGSFERQDASIALGLVMLLRIGFVVCLVLAQQRFLQNKGLVLLTLTAFLGTIIVSFLHGVVPLFLVSITDAVAAIILGVIAAIWAIILLVSGGVSAVKALRVDRG